VIQKAGAAWNRFWFESDGRVQLRAFRIGLALLLFACYAIRSLDLELFFGEQGIMPASILPDVMPMQYRYSIFRVFTGNAALWIGNFVLLAGLLAMAFGKGVLSRLATFVVWFVHLSFVHRNLAIAYGVDTISCFFLFYLLFADDRDDRAYRPGDLRAVLGSMAYRLSQIQVCIIYGYSGLKKLKGFMWWNGDAIWGSLAGPQLARWDFSWLAHFPLALAGVTYLTVVWEIYFPVLVWIRPVRAPLLIVGLLLHLGIAVGLNLVFFAALMALTYVLFLDRATLSRVNGLARGFISRRRRIFATRG
jgi:hypothetical protein